MKATLPGRLVMKQQRKHSGLLLGFPGGIYGIEIGEDNNDYFCIYMCMDRMMVYMP